MAKAKARFLTALRDQFKQSPPNYNPSEAAKAAGFHRATVYRWAEKDADFDAKWRDIADAFTDSLESRAAARAYEGSDLMMIFLLKALRPEKYREQVKHELSGPNSGPIPFSYGALVAEIEAGSTGHSEG